MKNQKAIGEYTELQCITYLVGLGYTVSTPYGDNAPYDFILEVDNKLYKIQCKTAFVVDEGVWGIRLRRVRINSKQYVRKGYTSDEVDFFLLLLKAAVILSHFLKPIAQNNVYALYLQKEKYLILMLQYMKRKNKLLY